MSASYAISSMSFDPSHLMVHNSQQNHPAHLRGRYRSRQSGITDTSRPLHRVQVHRRCVLIMGNGVWSERPRSSKAITTMWPHQFEPQDIRAPATPWPFR